MDEDETFIKRIEEPRCCLAGAGNSMLVIVAKRSDIDINFKMIRILFIITF